MENRCDRPLRTPPHRQLRARRGNALCVDVAGVVCSLSFAGQTASQLAEEIVGPFKVQLPPDAWFDLEIRDRPEDALPCETEMSVQRGPGGVVSFSGPGLRGAWDPEIARGTVLLGDTLALNRALRVVYSLLLQQRHGALIHAAAVDSGDGAHIFFGESGAGKTTIARISSSEGKRVLSDEMPAVRFVDGKYRVFGTPFWGEFRGTPSRDGCELRSLIRPVKAPQFRMHEIRPAEAVVGLMRSIVNFLSDEATNQAYLDMAVSMTRSVPSKRMEFRRTDRIWN